MKRYAVVLAVLFTVLSGNVQAQRIHRARRQQVRLTATLHGLNVTVTPSLSATNGDCVSPCVITYEIYRGTAAGAEDMTTPLNPTPLTSANLVFKDTTGIPKKQYFYVVQAVATSGTSVLGTSASSSEVSATFPPIILAPGLAIEPF